MKKIIKLMVSCLVFCILCIGIGKFFRYLLSDDASSYTRVTFHEMYEQDNIDILFVGSSLCYKGFIPEIFDEKLGLNTFNAGTSGQHLDGSYMVIKEAAKYHDIKHIYLELYHNIARSTPYKSRKELTQTYIISDYLRPSLDKFLYMLNASGSDHYANSFIVARRNWTKLFDMDYMKNVIARKRTDAYKKYDYKYITGESEWYAGKGYVANSKVIKDWDYFYDYGLEDVALDDVSEDWMCSLEDIIAFCAKRNIPLTLVAAPMSDYRLTGFGDYDRYIELVQSLIEGTDVDYYDFNLCKEEFFPSTSSLFMDDHHLNCHGAERFSSLFADFLNGEISEDELFHESYAERAACMEPTVFGIKYQDHEDDNGRQVRECKIIATENGELEYEIVLAPAEGEAYKVQDFSDNDLFAVMPDEHGVITVTYRPSDRPDITKVCNVSY